MFYLPKAKGFILLYFLYLFLFVSGLYIAYAMSYQTQIIFMSQIDMLKERTRLEREVIMRIREEYIAYEEKDFTMNLYDSQISVTYDGLTATIVVGGKYNFHSQLVFDDFSERILEYNYLNE